MSILKKLAAFIAVFALTIVGMAAAPSARAATPVAVSVNNQAVGLAVQTNGTEVASLSATVDGVTKSSGFISNPRLTWTGVTPGDYAVQVYVQVRPNGPDNGTGEEYILETVNFTVSTVVDPVDPSPGVDVKAEIAALRAEAKAEIAALRAEAKALPPKAKSAKKALQSEIKQVRKDLQAQVKALRKKG